MNIKLVFPNDQEAVSHFLSSTRQEMYHALELFHNHVKYTISLMFTLLTAVFAIFSITGNRGVQTLGPNPQLFQVIAGIILVLLFPLGIISILIIGRYYKLYVGALVFATEAHESVGMVHLWFRELTDSKEQLGKNYSEDKFVRQRTYGWPHSWILYSILIALISVLGLFVGILVLSGI